MNVKLVEITRDDTSWKGTWYRVGQRHFVRQYPDWPRVMACRWDAGIGGIHEEHCRVLGGPIVWLRCLLRAILRPAARWPEIAAEVSPHASTASPVVLFIARRLLASARNRDPDFVVGGVDRPYLLRWYVTPWRGWFRHVPEDQLQWWQRAVIWCARWLPNVYLHCFLRSDDDRALHDHPWLCNCSLVLWGAYTEHTIAAGGIHRRKILRAGALRFRLGRAAHRIELHAGDCWTLFVTGPVVRDWGFHCPDQGWVPWQKFTAKGDPGAIGRGCDA